MDLYGKHVLVTGGAGFIGSHLTERLLRRSCSVRVIDNCLTDKQEWLPTEVDFVSGDIGDCSSLETALTEDIDIVFHLASQKDVNNSNPRYQFRKNTEVTYDVLSRMAEVGVEHICFTSSSTVYGEAPTPTSESYGPLMPISSYGVSKLANEGLVSKHVDSNQFSAWIFRFANIVGPRLRGAVIPDFIQKLRADPTTLEILGNGRQKKSYMYIDDCIDAMIYVIETVSEFPAIYNLGTRSTTSVTQIAEIVAEELGIKPTFEYTGGDRGWQGDVPKMQLDIERLTKIGWEPTLESNEAVRRATKKLKQEI